MYLDTLYSKHSEGEIEFIPFPKVKWNLEQCKRWINVCGRPCEHLNTTVTDVTTTTSSYEGFSHRSIVRLLVKSKIKASSCVLWL